MALFCLFFCLFVFWSGSNGNKSKSTNGNNQKSKIHKKFVAKEYIDVPPSEQSQLHQVDVKLQMRTKYLARMYDSLEPPKKVRCESSSQALALQRFFVAMNAMPQPALKSWNGSRWIFLLATCLYSSRALESCEVARHSLRRHLSTENTSSTLTTTGSSATMCLTAQALWTSARGTSDLVLLLPV